MRRYRGSKMWSGSNACGKSTTPGSGITGSCLGKVTDEGMTLSSFTICALQKEQPLPFDSKRAKFLERKLSFDVRRRGDRRIHQSRAGAREQDARNRAKFADPHRAHGKIDSLRCDEIEQPGKLNRCVGACGNLEDICATRFGRAPFCHENPRRRSGFEIVE